MPRFAHGLVVEGISNGSIVVLVSVGFENKPIQTPKGYRAKFSGKVKGDNQNGDVLSRLESQLAERAGYRSIKLPPRNFWRSAK